MNKIKFQPVIKWSGSKRPIAQDIVDLFPREINNYYEPFCGNSSFKRTIGKSNDSIVYESLYKNY